MAEAEPADRGQGYLFHSLRLPNLHVVSRPASAFQPTVLSEPAPECQAGPASQGPLVRKESRHTPLTSPGLIMLIGRISVDWEA